MSTIWTAGDTEFVARLGDGRRLLYIAHQPTTTCKDWRSHYELSKKPRRVQTANAMIHMGLSMWDDHDAIRWLVGRYGAKIGSFVVEVELRSNLGIWFAATNQPHHFTVWGRPIDLQRCAYLPGRQV